MSERIAPRTVVAIVMVEFVALGSLTVPLMLGLALSVRRLDVSWTPEEALSLVTALGAVAAMVANPIFGSLSDRTRHRGSGRAIWVLGGVLAGTGALVLVATAGSLMALVVAWCLAQVAYNATFAGLYGLIADHVTEPDRARVSGWFGAAAVASVVFSMGAATVLPKDLATVMLPMPLLALPVTVLAYLHLRRVPCPARRGPGLSARELVGVLAASTQYGWVWVQRLLVQLAYGIVAAYGLYFLMRRVDLAEDVAATWVAATAASAAALSALTSVVAGRLAGRRGNYGGYIMLSVGLIVVALVVKAFGTSLAAFVVASLLVGAGIGCYYAVDLALVLRTVPPARAGQFLGFFNIARTLPQSLAPAIAPLLLAVGSGDVVGDGSQNYFVLYAFGIVIAVLSLLPLRRIMVLRRDAGARAPG